MNKDTQSWSNSNLTEMEELLQKTQQLERENAALRSLIDDPNAMHSHYLRECNGWEVWQAERIRQFQDASEQLEQLEIKNAALKDCLDWAETILCNSLPMQHSTLDEWNEIINKWRDSKHAIDAARAKTTEAKP